MKKNSYILIFTLFLLSNSVTASIDDVEGAFGIGFGETLPVKELFDCEEKNKLKTCVVIPPKPYASFISYSVTLFTSTNVVFRIFGSRLLDNYALCLYEAESIINILKDKYDINFSERDKDPSLEISSVNWNTFKDNNTSMDKGISISCHVKGEVQGKGNNVQLLILYFDGSTRNREYEKALRKNSKAKGDDSGL